MSPVAHRALSGLGVGVAGQPDCLTGPDDRPTSPPFVHVSWGKHGIWPRTDYTGGDDAVVIYWDPKAKGVEGGGQDAEGSNGGIRGHQ